MNTASLVGRLTRDIELRYTQAGKAVGSFTLAVNRSFTNQQGEREADFINCVIWGKGAETLANYTRKGHQLGVVGSIMTRNYENQQGQKVYVTEINVRDFDLLEPRKDGQQAQGGVIKRIANNSHNSSTSNRLTICRVTQFMFRRTTSLLITATLNEVARIDSCLIKVG